MRANAAGLRVDGHHNPNWKGGKVRKECVVCSAEFFVSYGRRDSARFCSLRCVGADQRGKPGYSKPGPRGPRVERIAKNCRNCGSTFEVTPGFVETRHFCAKACQFAWRSNHHAGSRNPNWKGGLSNLPYPFNFRKTSREIIEIDGRRFMNPACRRITAKLSTHHINYDKMDCRRGNLIALCISCNSRANTNRPAWQKFYSTILPFFRNGSIEVTQAWP
jgi:hypothetical protein